MRRQWKEVVKLVFKGQRFQDHALDLHALSELSQFQKIVTETAKAVWRAANPDRKNLPARFEERTHLYLRRVEEGSAAAPLEVFLEEPEQKELFEPEALEVVKAVRLAHDVYRAVQSDTSLPEGFPRALVADYEAWGESLAEDEAIEVILSGAEPVCLTPSLRSRLATFGEASHKDAVDITGEVLEADLRHGRFQVWLDETMCVPAAFTPEQESRVTMALRDHKTLRLQVKGRGEYSPHGKLSRVTEVDELQLHQVGEAPYDPTARPIEDVLAELSQEIPEEEWRKLPADLTDNLDHYLYGTPKP